MAVALSVILIWAITTGYAPHHEMLYPVAAVWFLCTAVYSFMSGFIHLRNGDSFTGTLQTFFGVFFFGGFAMSFLVGFFGPLFLQGQLGAAISAGEGVLPFTSLLPYALVVLATILAAYTVVVILMERVVGIALIIFVVGLYVQGIAGFMGMPHVQNFYGGWIIGIAGFIMLYAGIAGTINEPLEREILPCP